MALLPAIFIFFTLVSVFSHLATVILLRNLDTGRFLLRLLVLSPAHIAIVLLFLPLLYGELEILRSFYPQPGFTLPAPIDFWVQYAPPSAVISFLITTITMVIKTNYSMARGRMDALVGEVKGSPDPGLSDPSILTIKSGEDHIPMDPERILYISAHGSRVVIHTSGGEWETYRRLSEYEKVLGTEGFYRIHRSFLINLKYLKKIRYNAGGSYLAFLNDSENTTLPVGRSRAMGLKQILGMK